MTLQECESSINGPTERVIGTYPIPFDMISHEHLIILHRSEHLNHGRIIISSDYSLSANLIDSDFDSKSGSLTHHTPSRETIVDFGSISTKIVNIKISGTGKKLVEYVVSDTLTFGSFSSLGIVDGSATLIVPSASFRYLKVRVSGVAMFQTANRIAVAGNGDILYVDDHNIFVFNPTTNIVSKVIGKSDFSAGSSNGELNVPKGMEFDGSGNLYVADSGNNRIQKFDSNYDYVSQFGSLGSGDGQFSDPRDVTIDSSGNVFVTDRGNRRIQKFNSSHVFQAKVGSSGAGDGQFNSNDSIAVDSSDNVYVVDSSNDNIQKFTNALVFSIKKELTGNQVDVVITSTDKIFVLDNIGDEIEEFNTSLVSQGTTSLDGTSPAFMAIDSSDNVYVSDSGKDKIEKYNSSLVFQSDRGEGNGNYSAITSIIDEIFVPAEGSGKTSSIILQMEDPQHTGIWINLPGIPSISLTAKATAANPTNDNLSPTRITSQLVPNCPTGKIRALVTIIEGKSKDTFVFVKYGKQA